MTTASVGIDIAIDIAADGTPHPVARVVPSAGGKVIETTAAYIEPITRFGRSDLSEAEPEIERIALVTLELAQTAHFSESKREAAGPLPGGVQNVNDQAGVGLALAAQLAQVAEEAPEALQRFADEHPGSYRRLMPAGAAFLRRTAAVGYQFTCPQCDGDGCVTCSTCNGHRELTCPDCGGEREVRCWECQGTTRHTCKSCYGRRQNPEERIDYVWDSALKQNVNVRTTVWVNCYGCSGTGQQQCQFCRLGWNLCVRCSASGKLTCNGCGGRGDIDCGHCQTTGCRHVTGRIESSIAVAEGKPETPLEDERAKAILTGVAPDLLPNLGSLLPAVHTVEGRTLRTLHSLEIPVQRASIQAGDAVFELHGFGPAAKVFDFRDIVTHMLQPDLESLAAATAARKGWRRRHDDTILPALSRFVRSEINMKIAESVSGKESDADAEKAVQQEYDGSVSREYIREASRTLRGAVGRVWANEVAEPALFLGGTAVLAGVVLSWLRWPSSSWVFCGAAGAGAMVIGWGATELRTYRRVATAFDEKMAKRVLLLAQSTGSTQNWRMGALGLILAGALAGAWLPVQFSDRPGTGGAVSSHVGDAGARAWREWQAQGPDVGRRKFPDQARLERWATGGDDNARLMLAWGLALGAGGHQKDLQQARRQLAGELRTSREGKVIQAVIVLNQESPPEQIRQAAADLEEAARGGMVEARYWHARALLAQQGPVYSPKRGIGELRQAALGGHGHAAFVLGRIYAEGRNGQARDSAEARRYLTQAHAAGVAQAQPLLAKL